MTPMPPSDLPLHRVSHFGSRRCFAQRLGAKPRHADRASGAAIALAVRCLGALAGCALACGGMDVFKKDLVLERKLQRPRQPDEPPPTRLRTSSAADHNILMMCNADNRRC